MDVVLMAVSLALGLGFVGRGLWVLARGGPLVIRSTGRFWPTPGRAAAFWLLIGSGPLVGGLLRAGGQAGLIGLGVAFWLGWLPLALCAIGVIGFRPHPSTP
ncbi:hypothetical protein AB0M54_12820 [Actinoplanes sp. NPDC051470]|uniref:hypothetical protein n=1 Tax=Actinoplanes sp. NPDC051470 TaxID=3157224 RepID=UPI00343CBD4A